MRRRRFLIDAAICLGVFLAVTVIAYVLGAPNTGQAATYGQLAFVAALAYVIIRRD
jgi:hypothetical protein